MLGPRVVLGVVGQVDCRLVVEAQGSCTAGVFAEFIEEGSEVGGFFGCFRGCDDLRLAGGQGDGGLLLAAPRNGGLAVHEYMAGRGIPRGPVRI
eukprot:5074262-Pleurochrysis_carterae.AAC.1